MRLHNLGRIVALTLLVGIVLGNRPAAACPVSCPADFNGDCMVNNDDVNAFLTIYLLLPKADFNHSGIVTVQDYFDFLQAWFLRLPSADVNGDGVVTEDDPPFYLDEWYFPVIQSPSTDFNGNGRRTNDVDDIQAFLDIWSTPCP